MKVTLAIFQLNSSGGKERDCVAIARFLAGRGHDVTVLTTTDAPHVVPPVRLVKTPRKGMTNHSRSRAFAEAAVAYRASAKADLLFAFERIPGADFFYAADTTVTRHNGGLGSWLPRRRALRALERGVFDALSTSRTFFLTKRQCDEFRSIYHFNPSRGIPLPLILHDERYEVAARCAGKAEIRKRLGLPRDAIVALSLGISAKRKGFDRALRALARHPEIRFVLAGSSEAWIERDVRKLKMEDRVHLMPYTPDVMDLMSAADFLIHPAREEAAGIVIPEMLLAGRPVIVSEVSGYSSEVERSGAGIVIAEPFKLDALVDAIGDMVLQLPAFQKAAAAQSSRQQQLRGQWLTVIADEIEKHSSNGHPQNN